MPNTTRPALITYDAKDPECKFPRIEQLRPPKGAPNVLIGPPLRPGERAGCPRRRPATSLQIPLTPTAALPTSTRINVAEAVQLYRASTPVKNRLLLTSFSCARALSFALALLTAGCVTEPSGGTSSFNSRSSSTAARLDAEATSVLGALYSRNAAARFLGSQAKAVLVFPDVVKGGFMFGGEIGNGVLRQNGRTIGYYNITAASYGFQAGIQSFGYALFLMNDSALEQLHSGGGFEIGLGPSLVIVDESMAKTLAVTTLGKDVYALVFNRTGLMAGSSLQGSKISRIPL